MVLVLVFIISLLPYIFIYSFLKKRKKEDTEYQTIYTKALKLGLLQCVGFVILTSGCLYITHIILKLVGVNNFVRNIYYNYIVLALSEEMVKYSMLKRLLKNNNYSYTWLDIVSFMGIIGIGFGLSESLVYAIGANAGMMLVRGISAMHSSYGLLMGYFLGKSKYTNKRLYTFLAIFIPFILHGTYDWCLSATMKNINENIAYISFILALVSIVINIVMLVFISKNKSNKKYNQAF